MLADILVIFFLLIFFHIQEKFYDFLRSGGLFLFVDVLTCDVTRGHHLLKNCNCHESEEQWESSDLSDHDLRLLYYL